MKTSRNEPCPCGSGLKYKRCCLAASAAARGGDKPLLGLQDGTILDSTINDVVAEMDRWSRRDADRQVDRLVREHPSLLEFIADLCLSLPPTAGNKPFCAAVGMVLMYERQHGRGPCGIDERQIEDWLDRTVQHLFSFPDKERRSGKSSKRYRNQPFLHRFIAETMFDVQDELAEPLGGFELARLFLVLKTTLDVLDEAYLKTPIRPSARAMA